jgi:hypothetical protein
MKSLLITIPLSPQKESAEIPSPPSNEFFFLPLGDGAENGEAIDTFGAGSVRIGGWSLMVVNGGKCSPNGWVMVGWMVNEVVNGCGWSHPPFCGEQMVGQILKNMIDMFRVESDVSKNHMVWNSCRFTKDCCCNDASCWGNDEFMVLLHRGFLIDPDS